MAFKLGDKRINPLKSKGFLNQSPFKANGNTMAYNNGEPEGDDKKPKTQQQVDAEATQGAKEDMKLVSTEMKKVEGGTNKIENFEGDGKSTGFSKDPAERAKQEQWIKDNPELYAKLIAEKKLKDQKITFIPDEEPEKEPDPKPKPNPKQKAKPSADQIGTKLKDDRVITGYKYNPRYDPADPQGMKAAGIEKRMPIYADVQKREATKDKTDNTVVIGSTGDSDRVKQAVDEQLQAKKNLVKTVDKS